MTKTVFHPTSKDEVPNNNFKEAENDLFDTHKKSQFINWENLNDFEESHRISPHVIKPVRFNLSKDFWIINQ